MGMIFAHAAEKPVESYKGILDEKEKDSEPGH
jgi:hypothetical protein